MEINNVQVCNVCLSPSDDGEKRVYVKALCGGEEVLICTSCIPRVIHESGELVKSNAEVKATLGL
ncbi:hypothetical protein [Sulfurospirillum sp. 1612]|uniref:hypothetical protein n=1 Tax=Sulfurospirillum sp. 1612 TaxID=3094835 RepID=UPI002F95E53F